MSARLPAPEIRFERVSVWVEDRPVLHDLRLVCPAGRITVLIGPAGAGKSGVLRLVNRLDDDRPGYRHTGAVFLNGLDVLRPDVDLRLLRRRVGMVFSRPTPFAGSVLTNLHFGLDLAGVADRAERLRRIEAALKQVGLWDELAGALDAPVTALRRGQQQRVCMARALVLQPEVLLLDDPTGSLDRAATAAVERALRQLRGDLTVLLVTHDAHQAARLADVTAYLDRGTVVEYGPTETLFTNPRDPATEAWLSRRFE